jgi:aspartate racemase
MKKIGIVGGTAWVSTIEYYAAMCELGAATGVQPEFSIESIDNARAQSYVGKPDDEASWARFDAYHGDALRRLERAGSGVALLGANTPHHRFAAITAGVGIPVVHIVDAVAAVCASLGIARLLLLGTALTMSSPVIRARYAEHGVDAIVPPPGEHPAIVALIEELQHGAGASAAEAIASTARPYLTNGNTAVGLACTELPLAFPEERRSKHFDRDGIRYLNTLAIHAQAAFDRASA